MTYTQAEKAAVYRVIRERRDMRHFTAEPIPNEVLKKLLTVARQAPSVGYMQPWRFIRITRAELRQSIHKLVSDEIRNTGEEMGDKREAFMRLKLEGVRNCAELWVAALMDGREQYKLGRRTMPEMDLASLSCAIQNVWLAARAENIGMGWVSFFDPGALASLLAMPEGAYPAAVLCIGNVDSFYPEPMLKTAGWDEERQLDEVLFADQWGHAHTIE